MPTHLAPSRPTAARAALLALTVAALAFAGAVFVGGGGAAPAADGAPLSVAEECQQALGYPARTAADRAWLRTCVHALTPPSATPTVQPTVPPTGTPTPSPTTAPPTTTPTPSPTTVPPTVSPTPSPTPTPSPSPTMAAWPNGTNTGVPVGWVPTRTVTGDLVVTAPGVVQDVRVVGGSIRAMVAGVTVRRAEVIDGGVYLDATADDQCHDLVIEDVWIHATQPSTVAEAGPVVSPGGYTARRVRIDGNITEGFRIGERTNDRTGAPRCGPVTIEDSFVRIDNPSDCIPGQPPYPDWHGDGIQGYKGAGLTLRHSTVQMLGNPASMAPCEGTSPLFWPDQDNGPITVDRVLVSGGAYYSARLLTAGTVHGLLVDAAHSGITAACPLLTWDATWVRIGPDYQVTQVLDPVPCTT